ncbi:MAG: leucine-rich repeat domain-containing protein [Oscillospiraceae bacterium]|nr:leucine-rich repeat domain-containing protein [Oscillospiraceae bacterium]
MCKKRRKLLSIILTGAAFFAFFLFGALSASAVPETATNTNGGLTASLTTDKEGYQTGEKGEIIYSVKNENDFTLYNVRAELSLPDGFMLMSGQNMIVFETLKAGEQKDITLEAIAGRNNGNNQNPKTGDSAPVGLCLTLLLLSAAGVAFTLVLCGKDGRKYVKAFSILLCLAVALPIAAPSFTASAAVDYRTVNVSKNVSVGGSDSFIYLYAADNEPGAEVTVTTAADKDREFLTVTINLNSKKIEKAEFEILYDKENLEYISQYAASYKGCTVKSGAKGADGYSYSGIFANLSDIKGDLVKLTFKIKNYSIYDYYDVRLNKFEVNGKDYYGKTEFYYDDNFESRNFKTYGDFVVWKSLLVIYTGKDENVVVPADLGITKIADSAFAHNAAIKTVVIPEGVVSIDSRAFANCYNLTSVTIPKSVIGISSYAIPWNEGLTIFGYSGSSAEAYCKESNVVNKETGEEHQILSFSEYNDDFKFDRENGFITGLPAGDKVESLLNRTSGEIKIFKGGREVSDKNSVLFTGMVVKTADGASLSVVIKGDISGNGDPCANDARLILRHVAKLDALEGAFYEAARITGEEEPGAADARMVLRYVAKLQGTL